MRGSSEIHKSIPPQISPYKRTIKKKRTNGSDVKNMINEDGTKIAKEKKAVGKGGKGILREIRISRGRGSFRDRRMTKVLGVTSTG